MGVSRQTVFKWENAHACPSLEKLPLLCKTLNTEIDDLISDSDYNEDSVCAEVPEVTAEIIGRNIKRIRSDKKLSQEALGEVLGITRQTVSRWETGIISPEFINVMTLSDYFAVMPSEILTEKPLPPIACDVDLQEDYTVSSTIATEPTAQLCSPCEYQQSLAPSVTGEQYAPVAVTAAVPSFPIEASIPTVLIAPAEPKKPMKRGKLIALITSISVAALAVVVLLHASVTSVLGLYSPILDLFGSYEETTEPSIGLEYAISGNRCGIVGIGQCEDTVLVIPSTYKNLPDDLPVTSIKASAFSGNASIKKVVLPNTLTTIEQSAFSRCKSLESINVPFQVTSIGNGAFRDCTNLKTISLPEGFSIISENTFYGCYRLESIVFPKSLDRIQYMAFWGCSSLKKIYYRGNRTDWSEVMTDGTNTAVIEATVYTYSNTAPTEDGLFWHYVDGEVVEW